MFEEYQICPYTGLRSFTEEESLYFKGREDHIEQATEQLQRNKFLMLTGASGDGKSSLVYAGIVPNARAGFLKSRYTQWSVADFRPERTPFKNLCRSLAKQLGIANEKIAEAELQHGFSALVDLYRNSKCFIDVDSVTWRNANDAEKAALKRSAANLIIIVDQFEEFFTNPENYHHGIPSRDSNLVLNILLETSRIALEEDLPIYVVFTMRSDYIGQCAAFRSLPEYIGFSQFFVPRLNRSQLQQVIEEPATLSGNRISRRLTERLIHDIAEGVDQLPILQHALNQIWHAANMGKEEMDLIHYAMVGGMSSTELPDEQVEKFSQWFNSLTDKIKEFYSEPNLKNVLDTHANKLYESAAEKYRSTTSKELSDEDAKKIIKTTFTCLTKIDQSRAVRNRMTLVEITSILGDPKFGTKEVGTLLNIFREPGNTFIRPFIQEDSDAQTLTDDDVLDITHESLIRNWKYLEEWAEEEFNNYTISLDFEQQLKRWVESSMSSSFLLSIGPLTYFEDWYNKVKPNAFWIARYLPEDSSREQKLSNARIVLGNANEFLKQSAKNHFVTRTIMRFGPGRIAAVIGLFGLLVFGSFVTVDYFKKQNDYVIKGIRDRAAQLSGNPDIQIRSRAWLICEELKAGIVTIPAVISSIEDPIERVNVATGIATVLVHYGRTEPEKEIYQSLTISDSLLNTFEPNQVKGIDISRILKEVNDLSKTLELAYYVNPSKKIESLKKQNAARSAEWAYFIVKSKSESFEDIDNLNVALEFAVNQHVYSQDQITELIQLLSPFEGEPDAWVNSKYNKDKMCIKGFFDYGFRFRGLYQELGYLYAAAGNSQRALQAVDSLLKYNQNYFQNDYATAPDNASHIALVFYTYGQFAELDKFAQGYSIRKNISKSEFFAYLLGRCKVYEFATTALDLDPRYSFNLNLGLEFSSEAQVQFFFERYRNALSSSADGDDRKYKLALSYKDEGIIQLKRLEMQGNDSLKSKYTALLDQAMELYRTVNPQFLNTFISVIDVTNNDNITVARKFLFLFPDVRTPFHPNEPQLFHYFYTSGCFLNYIMDNNLFSALYPTAEEQRYFDRFFRDYGQVEPNPGYQVANEIDYETLVTLAKNLDQQGATQVTNLDLLYLYLAREAGERNEPDNVLYYTDKLTAEKVSALTLNSLDANNTFRLVADAITNLTWQGEVSKAYRLVEIYDNPANRSMLYAYAATELMRKGMPPAQANYLIDSARLELKRIVNRNNFQASRFLIAFALAFQNEKIDEGYTIIKNMGGKWIGILRMCRALGSGGQFFEAVENIPDNISDVDYVNFLFFILSGYNEAHRSEISDSWKQFDENNELFLNHYIIYQDDKN
ncbi:MAG: hypothetical protein ABL895_05405 [Cyclobacteriaceae bacterium]